MSLNCDTPQTITFHKENSLVHLSKLTCEIPLCVCVRVCARVRAQPEEYVGCTLKILTFRGE